jgi:hypothetical protein
LHGTPPLNAVTANGNIQPMKTDLLIDGMLSGTGLRDALNGGYIEPLAVGISSEIAAALTAWQTQYESAHFAGFPEPDVSALDAQELILRDQVGSELPDKVVGYFSNGLMRLLP